MKKTALTLAALLVTTTLLRADEVALMMLKIGKEKGVYPIVIEFHEKEAPAHVENFKKLARDKFYNGLAIHRAFPHLLVQTGDPLSRKKDRSKVGTGGPGYTVQPEVRLKHTKGAVAAARLPDKINPSRVSNGSQFYICLAPMPDFDGQHTVFGRVISGLETLDLISTKPVDSNDNPIDRIEIRSLKIIPREEVPAPPAPAQPGAQPPKKPWWRIWG